MPMTDASLTAQASAQGRRGAFLTLEGMDGAGKTSHLATVCDWLRAHHVDFVQTREPGGTPLGERLRELVLAQAMQADTEALLMFAARAEHLGRVIRPALASGRWVLSDRFSDASAAYQGGGRGLGLARMAALEAWTHPDLAPDLTVLFDLPPAVAAERLGKGRAQQDRFETERLDFFERVRAGYLARAQAAPERFCVIDAAQPLAQVAQAIVPALQAFHRAWCAAHD